MPVVDSNRVTFSAKSRMYFGEYGTAQGSLAALGLLGQDAQMNLEQTVRQKLDGFPEVPVAEAIQAQGGSMDAVLREWKKDTLLLGLGLKASDITEQAGATVNVVDEAVTLENGYATLANRNVATGTIVVTSDPAGTTYTLGSDYVVLTDAEGRTIVARTTTGLIGAGANLLVDYDYTTPAYEEYPIGSIAQVRYWTIRFEEDLTNGGQTIIYVHKARVGIRGALALNSRDQGADLPVTIQAIYDETQGELMRLRNVNP